MYLGNTPTQQAFTPAVDVFSGNGSTTAFTLSRQVASVAQVQAFIENVPQSPVDAFTVSGNTITFTSAPPSGSSNIYIRYTSPITQVMQPSDGSVNTNQLVNGAVTPAKLSGNAPSITIYTSGSGTYTTPANAKALLVRMVGGGGGGHGSQSGGGGGTGGTTTFGTSLLSAAGGNGGNLDGGAGGTATVNSPAVGAALQGGGGSPSLGWGANYVSGAAGGNSPFGGGANGIRYGSAGISGYANTGGGGGGGGGSAAGAGASYGGAAGGAGGYVEAVITSPSASYSYAVGAGGTAGTAGSGGVVGGAGGSGVIIVMAFF